MDATILLMKTALLPAQVSVVHVLTIRSKPFKGTIRITHEKHLISSGNMVGAYKASLLYLLGIQPFRFTLQMRTSTGRHRAFDEMLGLQWGESDEEEASF
jgi:hypothetical protein